MKHLKRIGNTLILVLFGRLLIFCRLPHFSTNSKIADLRLLKLKRFCESFLERFPFQDMKIRQSHDQYMYVCKTSPLAVTGHSATDVGGLLRTGGLQCSRIGSH